MAGLEPRMIPVDGATLEVILGGSGERVICKNHPWGALTAESPPWEWDSSMGRLVGVNSLGVGWLFRRPRTW